MTDVSEQIAAAKIICTRLCGDTCVLVHNPDRPACTDENCKVWPVVGAAFTAAAQVREGDSNGWKPDAIKMREVCAQWCETNGYPEVAPSLRGISVAMSRAEPALMPIYGAAEAGIKGGDDVVEALGRIERKLTGATEPDNGPSVLGNEE